MITVFSGWGSSLLGAHLLDWTTLQGLLHQWSSATVQCRLGTPQIWRWVHTSVHVCVYINMHFATKARNQNNCWGGGRWAGGYPCLIWGKAGTLLNKGPAHPGILRVQQQCSEVLHGPLTPQPPQTQYLLSPLLLNSLQTKLPWMMLWNRTR